MPFLRVLRDKRGYETTYLMHWFREGTRQRSKILYVFRSPPGLKVGRHVFEPGVMRELEGLYPEIEFEWRTLVENQQVVETSPEPRRPRRRRRTDEPGEPGSAPASAPEKSASEEQAESPAPEAAAEAPVRPRLSVPQSIDGTTTEEQVAWLRTWHVPITEGIPNRTHDLVRQQALTALADRLNPDLWTGDDAVAQGLQAAAEALQRLSRVFARRRRRPRRGGRREGGQQGSAGSN